MPNQNDASRALVLTAHPDPRSATARTADAVAEGLRRGGFTDVVREDILEDGFDPTFGPADLAAYRGTTGDLPADVRAQQVRLERFDTLALVFPVYWWGLPGALKGWVDRVFTRGWAYDDTGAGSDLAAPQRLYFFPIGAVGHASYVEHGYLDGMRAQLVDGLAGYMGALDADLTLLFDGESDDPGRHDARESAARDAAEALAIRIPRDSRPALT